MSEKRRRIVKGETFDETMSFRDPKDVESEAVSRSVSRIETKKRWPVFYPGRGLKAEIPQGTSLLMPQFNLLN